MTIFLKFHDRACFFTNALERAIETWKMRISNKLYKENIKQYSKPLDIIN